MSAGASSRRGGTAAFVLRRLVATLLLALLASAVVFAVLNALPGDAAAAMLGTAASPETLAALRAELGLDAPFAWRWLRWLAAALTGDFGQSLTYGVPVADLLLARLAVTVPLALGAFALAVAIGVGLGAAGAARPGGPVDRAAALFAQGGVALPNFWIALLLVLLVSRTGGPLPTGGFPGWDTGPAAALALVLPALALALPQAAVLLRVTRAALLETAGEDFMRTARAKGLAPGAALVRHALPNAMVSVSTVAGLQFGYLLGGAVLVENVFALPGLGQLAFTAVGQRDLTVMQAVALLLAGTVLLVNLAVDILHAWLDPRLASPS